MSTEIKQLETLVVGSDEVLIVRLKDDFSDSFDWDGVPAIESLQKQLTRVLGDRYIVFVGDVEFAKVKQ